MGGGSWSSSTYKDISSSYVGKKSDDIFSDSLKKDMNPKDLVIRESRDSDEHPESLAVMVWLDVTGSMGRIPENIIKNELGTLMDTVISNGIKHPQILFGAIGDHISDSVPLQVGQYESSTEMLNHWLSSIHIEGHGGGQDRESYLQAWLVAGRHSAIDCYERRNQKGFLFTIGDEASWDTLDVNSLKSIMGYNQSENLTDKQLLAEAQKMYNVYHIHINEGSYRDDPNVIGYWKEMLGERLIIMNDYHAISATIATIIAVQYGADMKSVISSFNKDIAGVVSTALATVGVTSLVGTNDEGIMKL